MDEPAPGTLRPLAPPLPTTFGGVAAVARRSTGWLVGWQVTVAAAAAVILVAATDLVWGEPIRRAAAAVPETTLLRDGRLVWTGATPLILVESPFVTIVADPDGDRSHGTAADFTVFLEADRVSIRSLLGWVALPLPAGPEVHIGATRLVAQVTAWEGPFRWLLGGAVFLALLLSWAALATLYTVPVLMLCSITRREARISWCWKLAAAAVLPGAVLLTAAIGLYATRQLPLVGLILAVPAHILVGWAYAAGALLHLPRPQAPGTNPFSTDTPTPPPSPAASQANPFSPT